MGYRALSRRVRARSECKNPFCSDEPLAARSLLSCTTVGGGRHTPSRDPPTLRRDLNNLFDRPRDLGPSSHGTRVSDASAPALRVIWRQHSVRQARIDRPVDKRRASHPLSLPRVPSQGASRVRAPCWSKSACPRSGHWMLAKANGQPGASQTY